MKKHTLPYGLRIEVHRLVTSYNFRADKSAPDSFANNWAHNSEDTLVVRIGDEVLARYPCQSVANYCFGDYATADTVSHGDTVAAGEFTVKCFVEPRAFHGRIHAITNAVDLDGQRIDCNAMQTTADGYQTGRWLIHDRYSFKEGRDTRYAWSAGCFILSSGDLERLAIVLDGLGVQAGDEVQGGVYER